MGKSNNTSFRFITGNDVQRVYADNIHDAITKGNIKESEVDYYRIDNSGADDYTLGKKFYL